MKLAQPLLANQMQPASLDLRLGAQAYRVRASFLPGAGTRLPPSCATCSCTRSTSTKARCSRRLRLYRAAAGEPGAAADLAAATNPKSSTGRLDVFTRVIADGVRRSTGSRPATRAAVRRDLPADVSHRGAHGLAAQPDPLPRRRRRRTTTWRCVELHSREKLVSTDAGRHRATASRSPSTSRRHGTAWSAIAPSGTPACVDVDAPGTCACRLLGADPPRGGRRLILDPDQFYILASKEACTCRPTHAAEMVPFDPLVGEFRVHYAGFFDPGFGHAAAGGSGCQGGAGGAQPQGAVHAGGRADRRPPGLRAAGGGAGDALRQRSGSNYRARASSSPSISSRAETARRNVHA